MHIPPVNILLTRNNSVLWASLEAQAGKNPPEMQETQVQTLGQEDPWEKGMATYSSILAWRVPGRRAWWAATRGVAKSRT